MIAKIIQGSVRRHCTRVLYDADFNGVSMIGHVQHKDLAVLRQHKPAAGLAPLDPNFVHVNF